MTSAQPAGVRENVGGDVVLAVRNLTIEAPSPGGAIRLVDDVSFDIRRNEVLGIVGESGSGKSLTMLAVLGLLPPPLRMVSGRIVLKGRDITALGFAEMRKIRGKAMSIVFQDPMTSLNPVLRVGNQIGEAIVLHSLFARGRPANPARVTRDDVRQRVIDLLRAVGIPDPEQRYRQYPHEFSGGMRQRVMIAMAMANEPDLLIADEPTTALDVTIQAQIIGLLAEVRQRTGAAMVLITHDLRLVAETADRIGVMYGGRIVETSPADLLFSDPKHPYTAGLINSLPSIERKLSALTSIPGLVPDPAKRPAGCAFHPRCGVQRERPMCAESRPKLLTIGDQQRAVACHFSAETAAWRTEQEVGPDAISAAPVEAHSPSVALKVDNLSKDFRIKRSLLRPARQLRAVCDVSFQIARGRTLGLVGESGCGKSTLARVILKLLAASGGDVFVNGEPFTTSTGARLRRRRRHLQVVFQDPYSSLDPRMTVNRIIAEPMRIQGSFDNKRVEQLLAHVGLTPDAGLRRPGEFSGGQRQRIAIARALALSPDILILDEAVSALDVSIQAQVINLLMTLQRELGLTYLFISHDLSVVRHISDDVAVMYLGRIVEQGPAEAVFATPGHPYTQALLSAVPDPDRRRIRMVLAGDQANPMSPPSGCVFRGRCPRAVEACAATQPQLTAMSEPEHLAACHFPGPANAND